MEDNKSFKISTLPFFPVTYLSSFLKSYYIFLVGSQEREEAARKKAEDLKACREKGLPATNWQVAFKDHFFVIESSHHPENEQDEPLCNKSQLVARSTTRMALLDPK